jgi:hypothetical protein
MALKDISNKGKHPTGEAGASHEVDENVRATAAGEALELPQDSTNPTDAVTPAGAVFATGGDVRDEDADPRPGT